MPRDEGKETPKIPSPGALPLATQHSKCDFAPLFVVGAAAGAETCSPWMLKNLIHISLLLTNKVQAGSERHRKAPSTGLAQGASEVQNCPGADIALLDQPHSLSFLFPHLPVFQFTSFLCFLLLHVQVALRKDGGTVDLPCILYIMVQI